MISRTPNISRVKLLAAITAVTVGVCAQTALANGETAGKTRAPTGDASAPASCVTGPDGCIPLPSPPSLPRPGEGDKRPIRARRIPTGERQTPSTDAVIEAMMSRLPKENTTILRRALSQEFDYNAGIRGSCLTRGGIMMRFPGDGTLVFRSTKGGEWSLRLSDRDGQAVLDVGGDAGADFRVFKGADVRRSSRLLQRAAVHMPALHALARQCDSATEAKEDLDFMCALLGISESALVGPLVGGVVAAVCLRVVAEVCKEGKCD